MHIAYTSLYTNIPQKEGIKAIQCLLAILRNPTVIPYNGYIMEPLRKVLENKYFNGIISSDYWDCHMHQAGTILCQHIYDPIEDRYEYTYPQQPFLWKRFIDDIFLIWTHSIQELDDFINQVNNCHATIKFIQEVSHS